VHFNLNAEVVKIGVAAETADRGLTLNLVTFLKSEALRIEGAEPGVGG
jgi:hypothetical protein